MVACANRFGGPIAQLDRASDYGSEGWGFKSSWARQFRLSGMRRRRAVSLRAFPRFAAVALALTLALSGCARQEEPRTDSETSADSVPAAALTERAQRDSARVAALVIAYFDALSRNEPQDARELFFPESIAVATPEGGVEVEGRSGAMEVQLAADSGSPRVRRLIVLRRASTELLENQYREIWFVHWVQETEDSTEQRRRIHVLQQLGNDDRWLGRMHAGE
jgi:hypothetical protein